MTKFNKIGLVGRPDHKGVVTSLKRLTSYLVNKEKSVFVDEATASLLDNPSAIVVTKSELSVSCDLVIVVGGDGSMLNVSKYVASADVPVIGVNRGKLGFLTDILPDEIESKIDDVLSGSYSVEKRFLLDIFLLQDGDSEHFIATPTGSTAYALSAGGPIMHPSLDAMVLAPMYPHSLSSRPVVVDGESQIKIMIPSTGSRSPQISCDGDVKYSASSGDQFLITKKKVSLHLIHPPNHSFYEACRSKLGWGSRLDKGHD
jgi:NAD+ kinase